MASPVNDLLIQTSAYAALMIFTILGFSFFLRGFFWKYFKVRTSFGKNVMVKVRTPLRDYYAVGWVEENFLCYKSKPFIIRIAMDSKFKIFYRSLSINFVDVDEEKNAICTLDYSPVTGFDAKKHSDLLTRALMRPAITSGQEKIILICVLFLCLASLVTIYLSYSGYAQSQLIYRELPGIITRTIGEKGTVIATNTLT